MRRFLLATLVFLHWQPLAAAAQPARVRTEALAGVRAAAPGRIEVRWTPDRTRIRTLAGALTAPRPSAPEEIAREFLRVHGDLFGLRPGLSDLKLLGVRRSPGGRHVAFEQEHGGLPVFESGLDLHVRDDGSVYLVHNDYEAAIASSAPPRVSPAQAAAAARAHFRREYVPAADRRGPDGPGWATSLTRRPRCWPTGSKSGRRPRGRRSTS